ncbi:xanthine dehydrogenase family protein [Pseudonocardia sp. KRD-184]|uniref:Xanthine dehydrogenase family protein n=1 Tax=Pseudonocardia oceani TaxID=2792013 RepID=A0ABS6UHH7_9PSEU|nr:xanthine dehydrogenase family protein molybdopterin-binding subunit [Pseudonocardia oceani]MBW0092649.1 xanthine dehydrogenase family protein [Pseudonocardia oceani]MBW0097169.1 xanthine dehydrogenase family protein [Pseudonocardia oceani]MBW0112111.1 xanthine dehydrogenase family protein [Pseudonocardia oceani]MBW0125520.1 xanthine dehydrogenase family protein [Pseudonocardia oceani]MBW0131642.1 xanthine dehydrogenase family protein [Pseudonocardia oceani]
MSSLGSSPRRKEDRRLVTGHGRFVSDLELPRMRHVAFLRSPYGHARITGVDAGAARAAGYRVFTGTDFAHVALRAQSALPSYVETDQPVIAHEKVCFAGETVAAVVARSRYHAEDGLELIEVDYEPLPPTVCAWDEPREPVHPEAPDNVLLQRTFDAGSVEDAFAAAAVVVERELVTNRHSGNPMECRAGVALWNASDRKLTFWNGTQVPHIVRNMIAELMDLPEGNVRVIAPDVGGGFGVKAVLYPEDVALCLMARAVPGVPLKWVEDRAEHLLAATHARDHRYVMKAGFATDGELLAVEADVTCNVGAYSVYPWTAGIEPLMAGGLLSGPYKLTNYRATVRGVATNTAPSGPYRGVARPSSVFAMEAVLDDGARELGLSGVDIRRRNLIRPEDIPYRMPSRLVDDSGHYDECLTKALDALGYDGFRAEQERRRGTDEPQIGIGFACYNELTGLGRAASAGPRMPFRTGHDACTVRMNPDGRVTVFSGVTSQGQGLETTMAQIVADGVGVSYDDVEVRIGDTDESLWGFGAFSSRQAVIGGGAAHRTAEAVKEKVLLLAAGLLEADPADLRIEDGQISVVGEQKARMSVAEVARVAYLESNRLPEGIEPGLEATKFYDPIRGAFAAGAQVAAIEVDRTTGELTILRYVCVEDAGRAMHPQIVDGQILGSIAQGIGGALYEHLVYDDDGNLSTGTLLDYLMPTSAEVPDMVIGHVAHPADNPLGVRGVGEGGTLGPNAVLAGAVADALGVRIDTLPITPASVWTVLQ